MTPIVAGQETYRLLPQGTRQDLRVLPTEELLYQRDLMGFITLGADDVSSAIAAALHQAITDEISYRRRIVERHKGGPMTPRLPDTTSKAYQDLLELASAIKVLWPIDAFVTRVMAVQLRRVGKRLIGRCPLPDHRDSSPSFTVYPADDRWHCFGCNRGGDIFELAGVHFGLDRFRDKVERIEEATPGLIEEAS